MEATDYNGEDDLWMKRYSSLPDLTNTLLPENSAQHTDAFHANEKHRNNIKTENMATVPNVKYLGLVSTDTKLLLGDIEKKKQEEEEETRRNGCCGKRCKRKPKVVTRTVGTFELFRYAKWFDLLLMCVGTLAAMVAGCSGPANLLIYGQIINVLLRSHNETMVNGSTSANGSLFDDAQTVTAYFSIIGMVSFISNFVSVSCWCLAAERQVRNIRKKYFRAIMKQDIGWFDTHKTEELNAGFSQDMQNIAEGMGDKMAVFVQWMATWVAGYVLALTHGWKMALIVMAFSPFNVFAGTVIGRILRNCAVKESQAYAKAGGIAEEVFRAIRTVHAFQGQEKEGNRYQENLLKAKIVSARKGLFYGLGISSLWVMMLVSFALAFWYGIRLIQTENLPPGNIMPVFFGVIAGSSALGQAFPTLETFANARGAAAKAFEIIDTVPDIDVSSDQGEKPSHVEGNIEFRKIHFSYPSRPDVKILSGFNLTILKGQMVALVGPSGCGKSTTVQLLQRFYDPEQGQIYMDGRNIKDLNLNWLRQQIGVVSQEPVLFATTIAENIRYGRMDVTQAEIETAAKEANMHNFISKLPLGYQTLVGDRGGQLSGGQKQRIAIARALVRNPKILLLDEATSALDHESEAMVQSALEKAEIGRTTIVIAHRLTTVQNADVIVSISNGEVCEKGTHEELMVNKGLYYQLVKLQTKNEDKKEEGLDDQPHSFMDNVYMGNLNDEEIYEEYESDTNDEDDVLIEEDFKTGVNGIVTSDPLAPWCSFCQPNKNFAKTIKKTFLRRRNSNEDPEIINNVSLRRIIQLNSPEWPFILLGCLAAFLSGCNNPAFAFLISEFIRVFSLKDDPDEQNRQALILVFIVLALAALTGTARTLENYAFAKSGACLTARLRDMSFRAILKQDMEFFDKPENPVGVLTTRLASDTNLVQGATGVKVGTFLDAFATLVISLAIAFFFGWKLTLAMLVFVPVIIASGIIQGKISVGLAKSDRKNVEMAGKIVSEAVDNIRTVASLTREEAFIQRYEEIINNIYKAGKKRAIVFSATYAVAECIIFFAYAAGFTYGTYLISSGEMAVYDIFRVFSAIVIGAAIAGSESSLAPDLTKAVLAAGRLFALTDRQPKIDSTTPRGTRVDDFSGLIEIRNAKFHYPSRRKYRVLNGLSLQVNPGETVALVGSSGCGKSTSVSLIERFYDLDDGVVMADNQDIRELNLKWLRSQIALVSQEPTLFDCSIADNIAYGDNIRVVGMDEIIMAAKNANIHQFIKALPQGYETNVGSKGAQLSGGQKQRIAIARALVRNPKVLLLDEATSALDTESERIVQDALDKARAGRTCIVIAHRLSTIQNADKIAVIHDGAVVEIGTHLELLERKGAYYRLTKAQNRRQ